MIGNVINGYVQGGPEQAARRGADDAAVGVPAGLHDLLPAQLRARPAASCERQHEASGRATRGASRACLQLRSRSALHRCGRSCPCCWRSGSRSTRAARARVAGLVVPLVHGGPEPERVQRPDAAQRRSSRACCWPSIVMLIVRAAGAALALGLRRWRGARRRHRQPADAAAAGDARARVRGRPVPAVHDRVRLHRARHDGAGDRPGDVHALVGRADRARRGWRRSAATSRRPRPTSARRPRTSLFRVAAAAAGARDGGEPAGRRSRSRSTTSSSRSTWPPARTRRRCRCASTRRRAPRRRRRSTRWRR